MVIEPVMSFYFHGILREKHFKTCPNSKILLWKAGSHKAVFQHAKFSFCGTVWQFYEDSINSQLSAGSQVTEHQECTAQFPSALPGSDVLLRAPVCSLSTVCPTPPSLGGKQSVPRTFTTPWSLAEDLKERQLRPTAPLAGLVPQRTASPGTLAAGDASPAAGTHTARSSSTAPAAAAGTT